MSGEKKAEKRLRIEIAPANAMLFTRYCAWCLVGFKTNLGGRANEKKLRVDPKRPQRSTAHFFLISSMVR
jgi:hypothetical protein